MDLWECLAQTGNLPEAPIAPSAVRGFVFLRKQNMSKEISMHKQLIGFFSDVALRARGFRPMIAPRDAAQLQRVLKLNILDQSHWEQIILYYLADRSFKNLSPSIATMLSSTVINGLRNKMLNREQFYKELDTYQIRHVKQPVPQHEKMEPREQVMKPIRGMTSLGDRLKALSDIMANRPRPKQREEQKGGVRKKKVVGQQSGTLF